MARPEETLPLEVTLREVIAAQVLLNSGERVDAEALASLNRKLDAQLDAFRRALGTVRFGAVLKNAWRRAEHAPEDASTRDDEGDEIARS